MSRFHIRSNGRPDGTTVLGQDGSAIHGLTAASWSHTAGKKPTLELSFFGTSIEVNGEARFLIAHPVTGERMQVRRIEFADGSEWRA